MEKLVVMDYSDGSINVYDAQGINEDDIENHIDKLGHNLDECYYMIGDNITIHRFDLDKK